MQNTKYSRQREAVLEVLKNTKCHPNADWIYEQVRGEIPNISLATVYRNLAMLEASGKIKKIEVGTGADHFDGDISPHAHFVCDECGGITDIYADFTEMLKGDVQMATGAQVNKCNALFSGVCHDCLKE